MNDGLVVLVEFKLKPGKAEAFQQLIANNARGSVASEPGCRRFDVAWNSNDPEQVFLYEIYDDAAAFEHHKNTPHYASFSSGVGELTEGSTVRILDLYEHCKPSPGASR